MSLMLEEWNIEDAIKYNREDAREEGLEQGRQEGIREGRKEGRKEGKKEGKKEGRKEGRQEGMVYAYYEMNMQTNEIAKRLQLSEEEVLEIIMNMENSMK